MFILIILLTILLVVDCLFLGLLILVQLPKKEAGVGMAFGSGATDALFGAGSGTALSNLTKYSAGVFFVLVFVLSILSTHAFHPGGSSDFKRGFEKTSAMPAATPTASAPAAGNAPLIPLTITSNAVSSNPTVPAVTPPTNAPAAPAK